MEGHNHRAWKLLRQWARLRQEALTERNSEKLVMVLIQFDLVLVELEKLYLDKEKSMREPRPDVRRDNSMQKSGARD
jgi:hypothetical protein